MCMCAFMCNIFVCVRAHNAHVYMYVCRLHRDVLRFEFKNLVPTCRLWNIFCSRFSFTVLYVIMNVS